MLGRSTSFQSSGTPFTDRSIDPPALIFHPKPTSDATWSTFTSLRYEMEVDTLGPLKLGTVINGNP